MRRINLKFSLKKFSPNFRRTFQVIHQRVSHTILFTIPQIILQQEVTTIFKISRRIVLFPKRI